MADSMTDSDSDDVAVGERSVWHGSATDVVTFLDQSDGLDLNAPDSDGYAKGFCAAGTNCDGVCAGRDFRGSADQFGGFALLTNETCANM